MADEPEILPKTHEEIERLAEAEDEADVVDPQTASETKSPARS